MNMEGAGSKILISEGIDGTCRDIDSDYLCPICFEIFEEPQITRCGHSFCRKCLSKAFEERDTCPQCNVVLAGKDMFPNLHLNELVLKYKADSATDSLTKHGRNMRSIFSRSNTVSDINSAIQILEERKHLLETNINSQQNMLLYEFLKRLKEDRELKRKELEKQRKSMLADLEEVNNVLANLQKKHHEITDDQPEVQALSRENNIDLTKNVSLGVRQKFMLTHFDDLSQCYLDTKANEMHFDTESSNSNTSRLDTFREDFKKCLYYQSLKQVASLNYSPDLFNNMNIVSSIECNKDEDFFAIAGVTKKIKIYNYDTIMRDIVDIHYPYAQMQSNSKISCLSWNSTYANTLAASDYEGAVTVWDVESRQIRKQMFEHEKRCWSVDYNLIDPRVLASASDDGTVKIWSQNLEHSVASIKTNSNICCVKFNPSSSSHLAFGSADHNIYYYDLRCTTEPLCTLKSHTKTVSHVKFLDGQELVSSSTDSQLKIWNINKISCLRTLTGHTNEKNFIGLATDGDYIACGSENNTVYIYYKKLRRHLFSHTFEPERDILSIPPRGEQNLNEFISAVSWRKKSKSVIVANSQGILNILKMYTEEK